ncbi:MAG: ribosome maturation factor RimM [Cyanobacteria bacterium J06648_11]
MARLADEQQEWITVGKVVGAHGLKGALRILSLSDFPERFTDPGDRWLRPAQPQNSAPVPVKLRSGEQQPGKNIFRVRFESIRDRTEAETWVGAFLVVPAGNRLPLDDGEYHVSDLVGMAVFECETGRSLGIVQDILPSGHDLLEIVWQDETYLIPFVEAFVPAVDIANRRLEIAPLKGMLPGEEVSKVSNDRDDESESA